MKYTEVEPHTLYLVQQGWLSSCVITDVLLLECRGVLVIDKCKYTFTYYINFISKISDIFTQEHRGIKLFEAFNSIDIYHLVSVSDNVETLFNS